jgi:deazaflavin-dependent oxidoreductase (nitroreductase family)
MCVERTSARLRDDGPMRPADRHPPDFVRRVVNRGQRIFTSVEIIVIRRTGRSLGGWLARAPVCLLTTTGRRSGKPRTTPLVYVRDGEELFIVAAYGGSHWQPAWYLNLRANPDCVVEIGGAETDGRASIVAEDERHRLWPEMAAKIATLTRAQQRTKREIPLVRVTLDR